MAKIKKFQRVEIYLQDLKDQEKMSQKDLLKLHFKDLIGKPELDGIGDRTISNALKAFKKNLGVLPKQEAVSKRQKVREYLDEQLRTGKMTSEEMMELRYQDLMGREGLKGIGKTTISCTLSTYKKNYEKNVFESNILTFLDQEKASEEEPEPIVAEEGLELTVAEGKSQPIFEEPEPVVSSEPKTSFSSNEISVLRQMMDQYKENLFYVSEKKDLELHELKQALNFSGIDCQRILELYWKSRKDVVFPMTNAIQNQNSDFFKMESA